MLAELRTVSVVLTLTVLVVVGAYMLITNRRDGRLLVISLAVPFLVVALVALVLAST